MQPLVFLQLLVGDLTPGVTTRNIEVFLKQFLLHINEKQGCLLCTDEYISREREAGVDCKNLPLEQPITALTMPYAAASALKGSKAISTVT